MLVRQPFLPDPGHRKTATLSAVGSGMELQPFFDSLGLRGNEAPIVWATGTESPAREAPSWIALAMRLIPWTVHTVADADLNERHVGLGVPSAEGGVSPAAEAPAQFERRVARRVRALIDGLEVVDSPRGGMLRMLVVIGPKELIGMLLELAVARRSALGDIEWTIEEGVRFDTAFVLHGVRRGPTRRRRRQ